VSDDLIIAARQNDVASVRDCLNKGANVDAPIAPVRETMSIHCITGLYLLCCSTLALHLGMRRGTEMR